MTKAKATTLVANNPDDRTGKLKAIGGSASDAFNSTLANAALQTLWFKNFNYQGDLRGVNVVRLREQEHAEPMR